MSNRNDITGDAITTGGTSKAYRDNFDGIFRKKRVDELRPVFCENIPRAADMETGVLYVSEKYETMIHKCCCGCGDQAVTPFNKVHEHTWVMTRNGDLISLTPSILNNPCKAHYYITDNKVIWL